jgi:hypothetical protein
MRLRFFLLVCWLLLPVAAAAPPQTKLMYLTPDVELKLAIALKREYYPWPVMRVGVGQNGPRWFAHIRFWVAPGAGRAQVLRQARQAALLAFRVFPNIVVIDVDAAPEDDTTAVKAVPWFAATLSRGGALSTPLQLAPQTWFERQGPVTLRDDLHAEGQPAESMAYALLMQWSKREKPKKPR